MSLRVAIVGTGPAGMYTVGHLLSRGSVREVSLIDRLPTPGGLVRAGVAPDHPRTKDVQIGFERLLRDPRVHCYFNVEVGRDLSHQDLLAHHDAVVYAVGAPASRTVGLEGEGLPGSCTAADFVAWYNGHPDASDLRFDLDTERVVIVGSGNVALDISRILVSPIERLAGTDIADHALEALRAGAVEEVVVLARGRAATAAFTSTELLAITQLEEVDVFVDGDLSTPTDPLSYGDELKMALLRELASRPIRQGRRRIVLRFETSPTALLGEEQVTGIRVRRDEVSEELATGLVLQAIGYRGTPLEGLPFDEDSGLVPHTEGRVGAGTYVTGWAKRGPSGVIGSNKHDAAETVASLFADRDAGFLVPPAGDFSSWASGHLLQAVGLRGWTTIDSHERSASSRRPRIKVTDRSELLAIARASSTPR